MCMIGASSSSSAMPVDEVQVDRHAVECRRGACAMIYTLPQHTLPQHTLPQHTRLHAYPLGASDDSRSEAKLHCNQHCSTVVLCIRMCKMTRYVRKMRSMTHYVCGR